MVTVICCIFHLGAKKILVFLWVFCLSLKALDSAESSLVMPLMMLGNMALFELRPHDACENEFVLRGCTDSAQVKPTPEALLA